jgi:(aminoalkyl)phosphonate N-acetyltransferase
MYDSINIRKIEPKDLDFIYDAVCKLENDTFDFNQFQKIFLENIKNPNFHYFLAENELEKMGFISFHVQNLLHHCGKVGEIQDFFVDNEYRKKGIGKLLMDQIFIVAHKNQLKSIEVTSGKKRVENVAIYESLGFNFSHNKFTIYR